jgi:hypothetical protein
LLDGFQDPVAKGAYNLLVNCAKCERGQQLLIVCETEDDGYYCPQLAQVIETVANQIGLVTETYSVPLYRDVLDPEPALTDKMNAASCTVFLARLGDQIRFRPRNTSSTQIISYVLDCDMLASTFGTIEYQAFERLKGLINTSVAGAKEIHVTCPAGTDFIGAPEGFSEQAGDTTLRRFPVSVFAPIPAMGFTGRVAQTGFLTGTGSNYYTPGSCELKQTLMVNFKNSRIVGFDGVPEDVAAAKTHYEFVGKKYGIDTYFVHSWHAGIHPGCAYNQTAASNLERWSGGAFGNPRLLHFHTCGGYPPGEISLNVIDATVRIDGVAVWENGQLFPDRVVGGTALLDTYPDMRVAFENPATQVGQAENGQLMYA